MSKGRNHKLMLTFGCTPVLATTGLSSRARRKAKSSKVMQASWAPENNCPWTVQKRGTVFYYYESGLHGVGELLRRLNCEWEDCGK